MSVNRAQGATLDRVVVDLRADFFSHGQLYVALSRVRRSVDCLLLTSKEKILEGAAVCKNVVYPELLLPAETPAAIPQKVKVGCWDAILPARKRRRTAKVGAPAPPAVQPSEGSSRRLPFWLEKAFDEIDADLKPLHETIQRKKHSALLPEEDEIDMDSPDYEAYIRKEDRKANALEKAVSKFASLQASEHEDSESGSSKPPSISLSLSDAEMDSDAESSEASLGDCCVLCDGAHASMKCPILKDLPKDLATDVRKNLRMQVNISNEDRIAHGYQILPKPPDGHCLFHCFNEMLGKQGLTAALRMRNAIVKFAEDNRGLKLGDLTIAAWILGEFRERVKTYASKMRDEVNIRYAGVLEMRIFNEKYGYGIEVYQEKPTGLHLLTRIAAKNGKDTLRLVYRSQVHYDIILKD